MGEMQQTLERILRDAGAVTHQTVPFPTVTDISRAGQGPVVDDVYRSLGGALPAVTLNLRKWDMEFDGFAVELDEYLHFNRYRAITLRSPAYASLSSFPLDLYRVYCNEHEDRCLSAGGYGCKWSNHSCEHQFGTGAPPKNLEGGGAPRWKQRAFYDFVKDLSPLLLGVRVARVSVWDGVPDGASERTVADVLSWPSAAGVRGLAELVRRRGA